MDVLFSAPIGALIIALLRMTDVSMAMMRMLLAVRGHRVIAALIGFFEVLIWLVAVGKALEHLNSISHVVGYAAGFALGNYVGVWLEGHFALGVNVVRAVIGRSTAQEGEPARADLTADRLRNEGYAVTQMQGKGLRSSVDILNVVVPRKKVPHVLQTIRASSPHAFVSVEEVRSTEGGYIRPAGRKMPFFTWTREYPNFGLTRRRKRTLRVIRPTRGRWSIRRRPDALSALEISDVREQELNPTGLITESVPDGDTKPAPPISASA